MKQYNFPIVIEQDNDGFFAFCPELQGCYSHGDTHEEALANVKDAIRLHIEDRNANNEEISETKSVSLSMVEVAA